MERPIRERSGLDYRYEVVDQGLNVTVTQNGSAVSAILEWTFGGGVQGLTPVGRIEGEYFEHRVSYYPARGRPAITIGHPPGPILTARNGLGQVQGNRAVTECFRCHATGVRDTLSGPDLSDAQPGVRCERCHGPGAAHVEAAKSSGGQPVRTILNPGRKKARGITEQCGECHRLPPPGTLTRTPEKTDPFNVRFQPMGLMASLCFSRSRALSCVTCHDPHEDASKSVEFYAEKCLECHKAAEEHGNGCPRPADMGCVRCHMPKASPSPFLYFTDHRIRVQ